MLYIHLDFDYFNDNYLDFLSKGGKIIDIKHNIEKLLNYKSEKLFFYFPPSYRHNPPTPGDRFLQRRYATLERSLAFVDYHAYALLDPDQFNRKLIDWLLWYNTRRVHHAFKNRLSPLQFMLSLPQSALIRMPQESKSGWTYTCC